MCEVVPNSIPFGPLCGNRKPKARRNRRAKAESRKPKAETESGKPKTESRKRDESESERVSADRNSNYSSWWFQPTHLKTICSSNRIISPCLLGEHQKYLKPSPSYSPNGDSLEAVDPFLLELGRAQLFGAKLAVRFNGVYHRRIYPKSHLINHSRRMYLVGG